MKIIGVKTYYGENPFNKDNEYLVQEDGQLYSVFLHESSEEKPNVKKIDDLDKYVTRSAMVAYLKADDGNVSAYIKQLLKDALIAHQ